MELALIRKTSFAILLISLYFAMSSSSNVSNLSDSSISSTSTVLLSPSSTAVGLVNTKLYVILALVGFAACLVPIIVCVACWEYHRNINRKLAACGKLGASEVTEIDSLYKQALEIVEDKTKAKHILDHHIGTEEDDKLNEIPSTCSERVAIIKSCRNPDIPCFLKSHVAIPDTTFRMHVNTLKDYYKRPIYVCQTPLDYEFPTTWKLIDHYKIGTIIWLYIPDRQVASYSKLSKGSREIGDYKITCAIATRSAVSDDYLVDVVPCISSSGLFMPFSVVFLIAHAWKTIVTPKEMHAQCDIISFTQCHHDYMTKSGRPGLLVHHLEGVNVTAGFLAAYFGRQMLLDQRRVNVSGICRYIREYRHKAFTYDKNSPEQIQMVFMILGTFAKLFAKEPIRAREPTKHEEDKYTRHISLNDLDDGIPGNATYFADRATTFKPKMDTSRKSLTFTVLTSPPSKAVAKGKGKHTVLFPSFIKTV